MVLLAYTRTDFMWLLIIGSSLKDEHHISSVGFNQRQPLNDIVILITNTYHVHIFCTTDVI